jgi:hypothetical protein
MRAIAQAVRPEGLAIGRILIGTAGLVLIVEWWIPLARVASGEFVPVPAFDWTPAVNPLLVQVLVITGLVGGVLLLLGVLARAGAFLVFLTSVAAMVLEQQTYSHHLYLLVWMTGLLALSRCGKALALPPKKVSRTVPYWPIFLIKLQISVVYFWTGVSKMNEQYVSGEVLRTFLNPWVPIPDQLLGLAAVFSIGIELFLAFALWIPRLLLAATVLGAALHLGIVVLLQDPLPLIMFAMLMTAGYVQFWTSLPIQRIDARTETSSSSTRAEAAA